jgi:hypothetical protein
VELFCGEGRKLIVSLVVRKDYRDRERERERERAREKTDKTGSIEIKTLTYNLLSKKSHSKRRKREISQDLAGLRTCCGGAGNDWPQLPTRNSWISTPYVYTCYDTGLG